MLCLRLSSSELHNRGPNYETAACRRLVQHKCSFHLLQFLVCTFRRKSKDIFRDIGKRP